MLSKFRLLMILLPISLYAQQFDPNDIEDSIVQIVSGAAHGQPAGSGFFVSDNLLVTAGHVYWSGGADQNTRRETGWFVQKLGPSNKHFYVPISFLKSDDAHDVAIFSFDPKAIAVQWPEFAIKPLAIDDGEVSLNSPVVLFGYLGVTSTLVAVPGTAAGILSTPIPPQVFVDELVFTVPTNPGYSGGPIVSVQSRKVVGVMSGFIPLAPNQFANGVSRAVRSKYVTGLVASAH